MALEKTQIDWLNGLTGVEIAVQEFERTQAEKAQKRTAFDALIKGSFGERYPDLVESEFRPLGKGTEAAYAAMPTKDVLKKAYAIQFSYDDAVGKRHESALMEDGTRQSKLVDITAIKEDELGKLSDEDNALLVVATFVTFRIQEAAKAPPLDAGDSRSLTQGLVREGVIPDTMLVDELSQTQQQLNASYQHYTEDLEEYTKSTAPTTDDKLSKLLGTGGEIADITASLLKSLPGEHMGLAADIATLTALTLQTGKIVSEAFHSDGWRESGRSILDNYEKICTSVFALALPEDAAKLATQLVSAELAAIKIGASLAKDPPDIDGAVDALATGLQNALGAAGTIKSNRGDDGEGVMLTAIGKVVSSSIKSSSKLAGMAVKAKNGTLTAEDFVKGISEVGKESLSSACAIETAKAQRDELEEENPTLDKEAIDKRLKAIEEDKQAELEKITDKIDLATIATTTTIIVISAAKRKELGGAAEDIVAGLSETLEGTLKAADVDAEVAHLISKSFLSLSSGALIATHLSNGDDAKAVACMGSYLRGAIEVAGGEGNSDTEIAGQAVALAFQTAASSWTAKQQIDAGDYKGMVQTLQDYAETAVEAGLGIRVSKQTSGMGEEESTEVGEEADKLLKTIKEGSEDDELDGIGTVGAGALAFLKDKGEEIEENLAKAKELAEEERARAEQEERDKADKMMQEAADISLLIRRGDASDQSAAETQQIEKLIAQMQKDRMILELATKVASGGTAVAAQFIPALGAANAAIKLAANLVAAAKRAQALNEWIKSRRDFESAVSALSSSAASFVGEQKEQFSYYSIQAALDLANLIGESLKLGGITAAAGAALAGAATAAKATQDLIRKFYKEHEVKQAWQVTQKAMLNPMDRRLRLEAMEMNPTLAKYAMAWAAAEDNDPLAKAAVRQCGLTDASLREPSTNVKIVQKYLELYFNEDNQVRGRLEPKAEWLPSSLTLSITWWSAFKHRAVEGDKVSEEAAAKTPAIDRNLTRLIDLDKAASQWTVGSDVAPLDDHLALLDELDTDLQKWQGKYTNPSTHSEASEAVEDLRLEVTKARIGVNKLLARHKEAELEEVMRAELAKKSGAKSKAPQSASPPSL